MMISRFGRSGNSPPWYLPEMKRSAHCALSCPALAAVGHVARPKGAQNLAILRCRSGRVNRGPVGAQDIDDDLGDLRVDQQARNGRSAARCAGRRRAPCSTAAPASRGSRRSRRPRRPRAAAARPARAGTGCREAAAGWPARAAPSPARAAPTRSPARASPASPAAAPGAGRPAASGSRARPGPPIEWPTMSTRAMPVCATIDSTLRAIRPAESRMSPTLIGRRAGSS